MTVDLITAGHLMLAFATGLTLRAMIELLR